MERVALEKKVWYWGKSIDLVWWVLGRNYPRSGNRLRKKSEGEPSPRSYFDILTVNGSVSWGGRLLRYSLNNDTLWSDPSTIKVKNQVEFVNTLKLGMSREQSARSRGRNEGIPSFRQLKKGLTRDFFPSPSVYLLTPHRS